jgi:hypothetical protein
MTSLPTIAAAFGLLLGTANLAMAGPQLAVRATAHCSPSTRMELAS